MKKNKIIGKVILLAVVACVGYLFFHYKTVLENQSLTINESVWGNGFEKVQVDEVYSIITYNVGFGVHLPETSFFMDGGSQFRAEDEESVYHSINASAEWMKNYRPNFLLLQEVDVDSSRSYHVDQYELFRQRFPAMQSTFALNYDSSFWTYLVWDFSDKSKSGMASFSSYEMTEANRRNLPIAVAPLKLVGLDQCISVNRLPVGDDKELTLVNVHLSAYGNSDEVREEQLDFIFRMMEEEYEKGNYVIVGGDFYHDLKQLGADADEAGDMVEPLPRGKIPEHFILCVDAFSIKEKSDMWNTCRSADVSYVPGSSYTVTTDGFIVSDNVECICYEHINTGYAYSDHEPVYMEFKLK